MNSVDQAWRTRRLELQSAVAEYLCGFGVDVNKIATPMPEFVALFILVKLWENRPNLYQQIGTSFEVGLAEMAPWFDRLEGIRKDLTLWSLFGCRVGSDGEHSQGFDAHIERKGRRLEFQTKHLPLTLVKTFVERASEDV